MFFRDPGSGTVAFYGRSDGPQRTAGADAELCLGSGMVAAPGVICRFFDTGSYFLSPRSCRVHRSLTITIGLLRWLGICGCRRKVSSRLTERSLNERPVRSFDKDAAGVASGNERWEFCAQEGAAECRVSRVFFVGSGWPPCWRRCWRLRPAPTSQRAAGLAGTATPGSQQDFVVNVGDRVFFESDQTDLTAQARATLDKQAQWLSQYTQLSVHDRRPRRRARHARIQHRARRAPCPDRA